MFIQLNTLKSKMTGDQFDILNENFVSRHATARKPTCVHVEY